MKQFLPIIITLPLMTKVVLTDIHQLRIPNRYVAWGFTILIPTLYFSSRVLNDPASFSRAMTGGFCTLLFFLALHAVYPSGLGLGDVKLSGLLGAILTWDSFNALFYGVAIMFLASAFFSMLLILRNRANTKASIPFAPFMMAGTLLGVLSF